MAGYKFEAFRFGSGVLEFSCSFLANNHEDAKHQARNMPLPPGEWKVFLYAGNSLREIYSSLRIVNTWEELTPIEDEPIGELPACVPGVSTSP